MSGNSLYIKIFFNYYLFIYSIFTAITKKKEGRLNNDINIIIIIIIIIITIIIIIIIITQNFI